MLEVPTDKNIHAAHCCQSDVKGIRPTASAHDTAREICLCQSFSLRAVREHDLMCSRNIEEMFANFFGSSAQFPNRVLGKDLKTDTLNEKPPQR